MTWGLSYNNNNLDFNNEISQNTNTIELFFGVLRAKSSIYGFITIFGQINAHQNTLSISNYFGLTFGGGKLFNDSKRIQFPIQLSLGNSSFKYNDLSHSVLSISAKSGIRFYFTDYLAIQSNISYDYLNVSEIDDKELEDSIDGHGYSLSIGFIYAKINHKY